MRRSHASLPLSLGAFLITVSASARSGNAAVTADSTAYSAAPSAPASVDGRFGLVGTGGAAFAAKFGFRYYTLEGNYAPDKGTLFSSVDPANDPAPGFSVVREVAKLNVRTDGLGQSNAQFQAKFNQYGKDLAAWYLTPSWARGAKPAFVWYRPDAEALAEAESLQISETIKREKSRAPAIPGTVWEIGNEPNLFPAITPSEYAAIFAAYRRIIKAQDPGAVVAMGSLFLPEPAEDIKARLGDELAARMRAELETAGYYNTLNNLGLFNPLVNDMKSTLLARMLALPAREYLRQVLAAVSARPDIVSLHAYPFDDRPPFLDSAAMRHILDTTLAGIKAMLVSQGAVTAVSADQAVPLWITEFGNIEQDLSAQAVADRSRRLIDAFRADSAIARWFHYKSTGNDEQFAFFASGAPPLTRLSLDAAFAPGDGGFSCARLNAVGLMYWRESHADAECRDPILHPAILNPEASAQSHPRRVQGFLFQRDFPVDLRGRMLKLQ